MINRPLLACLLLSLPALAEAALHRCEDAHGRVRYSDRPCVATELAETRPINPRLAAMSLTEYADAIPIHPSWLDTPEHLVSSARCSERSCECGPWQYDKRPTPLSRLFEALRTLPGHWEHYEQLKAADELGRRRQQEGVQPDTLREAACSVRVEQTLIVELFAQVVPDLLNGRALAAARVRDRAGACARPPDGTFGNDPRWAEFRDCEARATRRQQEAERHLNHTHFDARTLDEVLPPLNGPRPGVPD